MATDDEFLRLTLPALDLVHNLARRFARGRADAEDLVQDTYLRAWQAWTTGTRPRRPGPWLATICLNLGRDRLRQASLRSELAVEPPQEPIADVDVEAAAIERVEQAQIERALWAADRGAAHRDRADGRRRVHRCRGGRHHRQPPRDGAGQGPPRPQGPGPTGRGGGDPA
jgi:RNA polymerase sigma factor (sigma-70 family)